MPMGEDALKVAQGPSQPPRLPRIKKEPSIVPLVGRDPTVAQRAANADALREL